jgi:acyl carrier protein
MAITTPATENMTTYDRLVEILICDMSADPAAIDPHATLADLVETGDDREMLWFMKYISDQFHRSISVQQIRDCRTVQCLANLIETL